MGFCVKCGKEDTLVRGLCSECLALEMEQEALEDDGELDNLYMEKHEGELEMTVENLKRQALAYQPHDRVVTGEMKSVREEQEERIKNIMNQAGLFEAEDRVKYSTYHILHLILLAHPYQPRLVKMPHNFLTCLYLNQNLTHLVYSISFY